MKRAANIHVSVSLVFDEVGAITMETNPNVAVQTQEFVFRFFFFEKSETIKKLTDEKVRLRCRKKN